MSEAAIVKLMLPLVRVEKSLVSEAKECAIDCPKGPERKPPDAHKTTKHKVVDSELHFGNGHLNFGELRRGAAAFGVAGGAEELAPVFSCSINVGGASAPAGTNAVEPGELGALCTDRPGDALGTGGRSAFSLTMLLGVACLPPGNCQIPSTSL